MESRPRPTLHLSPFDKRLETISKILLLVMWLLILFSFFTSPAIVPTHYNALGKADKYGSKKMLFIVPVLATVIYLGLTQLNKYPHIFNYMTTITEENAQQQYTIATRMLRLVKLSVLVIFTLLIGLGYLAAKGYTKGLGFWFLPFTFFGFSAPVFIAIYKSKEK